MRSRIDRRLAGSGAARRGPRGGFTLVEMLTVLFIFGIVVSLVVGVSQYVRDRASRGETSSTQALVMQAVQAFYEENGAYPLDSIDDPSTTNVNEGGVSLLTALTDCEKSVEILRNLSSASLPSGGDAALDAYGRPMNYLQSGGLGGKPVLISAGPDGDMDTSEDNVRSDRQ